MDTKHGFSHAEHAEKPDSLGFKAAAIEAENLEHNMTVMQAVRAYPMASFWAFIMSFTIVRCFFLPSGISNLSLPH